MQKKKINYLFLPVLSMTTLVINSCQIRINQEFFIEEKNNNLNQKNLTWTNYFEKDSTSNSQTLIKNQKKKITELINKYRLYEWNKYYETSNKHNNKDKSSVLNSKYISFKETQVDKKLVNNEFTKNLKWTSIYKNQDEQFRYFNDFINLIHEENEKNQEDFLYLRWKLLSIKPATKYKKIIPIVQKTISQIEISDWTTAVSEAVVSLGTNTERLRNIITAFLEFYGFEADKIFDELIGILIPKSFNQKQTFNLDFTKLFSDQALAKLVIASNDMYMRYSSKLAPEIDKYPIWKPKAKRAKNIHEKTIEYFNTFSNSFLGTKPELKPCEGDKCDGNSLNQGQIDQINGILNQLKDLIMIPIELAYDLLAKLELSDYANEKEVNKGAMKNV